MTRTKKDSRVPSDSVRAKIKWSSKRPLARVSSIFSPRFKVNITNLFDIFYILSTGEKVEFFVFRRSWDRRGRVDCSSKRVKFILLLKLLFQIKNFSAQNWKCSKTDEFHGFDAEQIDISLSQIIKKQGGWSLRIPIFNLPYLTLILEFLTQNDFE